MTQYLNPKYDFVFKKVFGSPNSVSILKSFLNAFISHAGLNEIIDLEILNPYQASKLDKMKDTYVDVKAKDKTGRIFIIEMQMLSVAGFEKRILYNIAKAYSGQINKGQDYLNLYPVISINFCDFNLFNDSDYFHSFKMYDINHKLNYTEDFSLLFIELKKVDKFHNEVVSLERAWLDFLNKIKVDKQFKEIKEALNLVKRTGLDKEELNKLENIEMYAVDYQRKLNDIKLEGKLEGMLEGKLKGMLEVKHETAKNMLNKGCELSFISDITGLSINEIKALM